MRVLGISLCALLLCVSSATAGLYPTRPVTDTVFSAGRMSTITWINDDTRPSLKEMGPVKIDLCYGDDIYVKTLAKDVEPTRRSKSVWISPTLGPNGSDYYLRFTCEDPPLTIYTARFTLAAMDDTPPYHRTNKAEARSSTAQLALANSATSILRSSPVVALPSASVNASTTSTSLSSSYVIPNPTHTSTNGADPYTQKAKSSAGSGSFWKRGTVDTERLKFRLVFILWPVLIGVTMAL